MWRMLVTLPLDQALPLRRQNRPGRLKLLPIPSQNKWKNSVTKSCIGELQRDAPRRSEDTSGGIQGPSRPRGLRFDMVTWVVLPPYSELLNGPMNPMMRQPDHITSTLQQQNWQQRPLLPEEAEKDQNHLTILAPTTLLQPSTTYWTSSKVTQHKFGYSIRKSRNFEIQRQFSCMWTPASGPLEVTSERNHWRTQGPLLPELFARWCYRFLANTTYHTRNDTEGCTREVSQRNRQKWL